MGWDDFSKRPVATIEDGRVLFVFMLTDGLLGTVSRDEMGVRLWRHQDWVRTIESPGKLTALTTLPHGGFAMASAVTGDHLIARLTTLAPPGSPAAPS